MFPYVCALGTSVWPIQQRDTGFTTQVIPSDMVTLTAALGGVRSGTAVEATSDRQWQPTHWQNAQVVDVVIRADARVNDVTAGTELSRRHSRRERQYIDKGDTQKREGCEYTLPLKYISGVYRSKPSRGLVRRAKRTQPKHATKLKHSTIQNRGKPHSEKRL